MTPAFDLRRRGGRLELVALHRPGYAPLAADWSSADVRRRVVAGRSQLLVRAAGLHRRPSPRLLDATGGLGRDAFTLAAAGAQVTMAERNLTVFRLVEDAHRRALADPQLATAAQRITVIGADARSLLDREWDVIYLDPMYPQDGRTALPQKAMQLLRELEGTAEDADALLEPARAAARRVVVKRPPHAPPLAGARPSVEMAGKGARYDVYLEVRDE